MNIKISHQLQFCLTAYTHFQNFASFFFTLHTNPRIAHTKCKMPHISCKMKCCIQNITNTFKKQTFVLQCKHLCHKNIFLDMSYTQLFKLCTFLYKIESNWQRDFDKFTVNTKARLKPNFFVFILFVGEMVGCIVH